MRSQPQHYLGSYQNWVKEDYKLLPLESMQVITAIGGVPLKTPLVIIAPVAPAAPAAPARLARVAHRETQILPFVYKGRYIPPANAGFKYLTSYRNQYR
jgi:hypothetical protein